MTNSIITNSTNIITNSTNVITNSTNAIANSQTSGVQGIFQALVNFWQNTPFFHSMYFNFIVVILIVVIAIKVFEAVIKAKNIGNIKDKAIKALVEKSFSKNFFIIAILVGIIIALDSFKIEKEIITQLRTGVLSVILIIVYLMARKLTRSIFSVMKMPHRFKKSSLLKNKNIVHIFERFVQISLFIIITMIIFSAWKIEIGPILTGLGIAGIAIGFALQDSLSNIFGGISLILDDAYSHDNFVELENGEQGTIYHIGYRSTQIKTYNDEIVTIPNGKLAGMNIKNLSRPTENYRLSLNVNVAYGSEPEHVKTVIHEALDETQGVLDFPEPTVFFDKMGDYFLSFKLFANIRSPLQKFPMTDKIYTTIYEKLQENNIKIPFPTSTIYIEKEGNKEVIE